jgi:hypothetical protein
MNTEILSEYTVREVLSNSVKGDSKSPSNIEYRYYHCYLNWNGLKCKKVDGPHIMPLDESSKLLFVKKYIPERFDKHILKYKWMPDSVTIDK